MDALRSSVEDRDGVAGDQPGLNSYMVKPMNFTRFFNLARPAAQHGTVINQTHHSRQGTAS